MDEDALREACERLLPISDEAVVDAWGDGYITHEQLNTALEAAEIIRAILGIGVTVSGQGR